MAHGIAGSAIAMTLAGATNILLTGWEMDESVDSAEDTYAGLAYRSRITTFGDYEITIRGLIPDQAARHVLAIDEATLGTPVVYALKEKSSDSTATYTGTALATRIRVDAGDIGQPIRAELRLQCSAGAAPTHDTTQ